MFDKDFEELKLTGNLPSPSGVGLAVLRITQSESPSLAELVQVVRADPALSGRLIKQANTLIPTKAGAPEESYRSPVSTVEAAARRLGASRVRSMALGFSLVSSARSGICEEFDYDRFWSLSICSAVAAEELARRFGTIDPDEAFTCALQSRVGMLALATVHPAQYSRILRETRGQRLISIFEAESAAFEITHPEVTAAMIVDWDLPEFFAEVVVRLGSNARASKDEGDEGSEMLQILNAAWRLAPINMGEMRASSPHGERLRAMCSALFAQHGCAADEVDTSLSAIAERCAEWLSLTQFGVFRSESFVTGDRSEPLFEDSARALAWTSTSNPSPNSVAGLQGAQGAFRPLVMLVDDDERILRLLSHLLERDGFRVAVARSGEEAMRLTAELSPHILITDWMMPGLSGIELCRDVKRREKSKDTYVIILTAREEEERVVESFDAGADDYVSKPFKPLVLLSRVRAGYRVLQLQKQVDRDRDVRSKQVAEMGALTRKLRSMTLTDSLTELPNRRFAMQKLEEAWRLSVKHERELSLVLLDIDHFKRVNDTHGHDVGDEVLAEVGHVLKKNVREGDIVCRFGGEEFIVITTSTGEDVAMQCAERLRVAMSEHDFECFEEKLTLSLGVAQRSAGMDSVDELIKASDEAVFEAKESGRNRSVVRSSMPLRKSA